jgi:hypothetical protein
VTVISEAGVARFLPTSIELNNTRARFCMTKDHGEIRKLNENHAKNDGREKIDSSRST